MLPICHEKYHSPEQNVHKSIEESFHYHFHHYFFYLLFLPLPSIYRRAYAGGRHSTLLPTDVLLDTGANCSIVHNRNLLTNVTSCNPAIFDGLSGSINITQRGSLGSICEAYYHEDIIANILSVLAIRSEGHTLKEVSITVKKRLTDGVISSLRNAAVHIYFNSKYVDL